MSKKHVMLIVPATILAAAGAATSTAALAGPSHGDHAASLSGTWTTAVTLTDAPTGVPAQFDALDSFVRGGDLLVSSSVPNPDQRGLAHGTWRKTGTRTYVSSFVWFRFDSSGQFAGTQRVDRTMKVSKDGTRFRAADVVEIIAPSGAVVSTLHGTEVGKRYTGH
jgi:hypothetical protein